jgi:SAM-dependent methyltransferase
MSGHRALAAAYDTVMRPLERSHLGEQRRALIAKAEGRVLEIGGGTGANLPLFSSDRVNRVDVIEPDPFMHRRLLARMTDCPVDIEVHTIGIEDSLVVFEPKSFDTIVSTLVFCSVTDLHEAISCVRDLIAPSGRLLFLEHVLGTGPVERIQRVIAPAWQRAAGGCRLDRNTTTALREAGFVIASAERFSPFRGRVRSSWWVSGEAFLPERAA